MKTFKVKVRLDNGTDVIYTLFHESLETAAETVRSGMTQAFWEICGANLQHILIPINRIVVVEVSEVI
jgi:hypothetical protein